MLAGTGPAAKVSSTERQKPMVSGLGASPIGRRPPKTSSAAFAGTASRHQPRNGCCSLQSQDVGGAAAGGTGAAGVALGAAGAGGRRCRRYGFDARGHWSSRGDVFRSKLRGHVTEEPAFLLPRLHQLLLRERVERLRFGLVAEIPLGSPIARRLREASAGSRST